MVDYWRRDKVPVGPWTGVTRYNVPVGLSRPGTQRRLEILHGSGPLLLFYTWVQMWSIENGSRTGTPSSCLVAGYLSKNGEEGGEDGVRT